MRLLIIAAVALSTAPVSAQVLAVDPDQDELVDFDDEEESKSTFWDQALSPGAGTYADLIDKAIDTISLSVTDAQTILEDAVARQPDQPDGHFWLGYLGFQSKSWRRCADGFSKALALSPDFAPNRSPPRTHWSSWSTDYHLGLCLALAGDLDRAAERLSRITSRYELCGRARRNNQTCYDWRVGWRLGEVLMALGRLEEAIAVLENTEQESSRAIDLRYTLAVALERDEQEYKSTELLKATYRNDHMARSLRSSDRLYIPEQDAYYYQALAAEAASDWGRALVLFRAYAKQFRKSPWIERANDHIARVARQSSAVEIRGRATFDTTAMNKVIEAAMPGLETCVEPLPEQVVALTIRRRITASSKGRRPAEAETTVHLNWLNPLGVTLSAAKSQTASACIRTKLDALKLPPLKGYVGESSAYEIEIFHREAPRG